MNRFVTSIDGGLPLRLDDFRWLETAQAEAFKAVIKTLIGDEIRAILYGCIVVDTEQGDVFTCTEGFVYFADEIFYVPAHQIVHDQGFLFFGEDISFDPTGNKVFKNAVAQDTYEIRRAKLYTNNVQASPSMLYTTDDFITILKRRLNYPYDQAWTEITLNSSNVTFDGTMSVLFGTMFYLQIGKTLLVSINLAAQVTAAGTRFLIDIPDNMKNAQHAGFLGIVQNGTPQAANQMDQVLYRLAAYLDENHLELMPILSNAAVPISTIEINGQVFFEIQ